MKTQSITDKNEIEKYEKAYKEAMRKKIEEMLNPELYWYVVMVVHPNLGSFECLSTATKLKKSEKGKFKRPKGIKFIYVDKEGNEYQEEEIICGMWDKDYSTLWNGNRDMLELEKIRKKHQLALTLELEKEFVNALKVCRVWLPDFNSIEKDQWVANLNSEFK